MEACSYHEARSHLERCVEREIACTERLAMWYTIFLETGAIPPENIMRMFQKEKNLLLTEMGEHAENEILLLSITQEVCFEMVQGMEVLEKRSYYLATFLGDIKRRCVYTRFFDLSQEGRAFLDTVVTYLSEVTQEVDRIVCQLLRLILQEDTTGKKGRW